MFEDSDVDTALHSVRCCRQWKSDHCRVSCIISVYVNEGKIYIFKSLNLSVGPELKFSIQH